MAGVLQARVVVVGVAGPYRSGKSSLLNWLRGGGGGGFRVGHGVDRCTRGLVVWGRPRAVTLADGSAAALLFLDSEGLGGLAADGAYDATVFALTALLSSTLAYNSHGALDERAIDALGVVARLASAARARAPARGDDAALDAHALSRHLPSFVWVLRDFALDLADASGAPVDASAYLEAALAKRDATRDAFKAYFPRRACAPLPRPFDGEADFRDASATPPPSSSA